MSVASLDDTHADDIQRWQKNGARNSFARGLEEANSLEIEKRELGTTE
jgi:hypothetical protein